MLESIVGLDNVVQLRTHLLNERFELARMIGKTTLAGKDVLPTFWKPQARKFSRALSGAIRTRQS